MKKLNTILFLCLSLCFSCFMTYAAENTTKLQSAFYIENYLDKALETEFCLKSARNKKKTIDYWSQKAGFLPNKIPELHSHFGEAEHVLFFDQKDNIAAEASYRLGIFYGSNMCGTAETQKAKYYLKQASKKADARFAYAMLLMRNRGKLADIYRLFNEAGSYGIGAGYYNAAILLHKKDKVKYAKKVSFLLTQSAKNGYSRGLNDLGVFMLSEQGVNIFLKPEDKFKKNSVIKYMQNARQKIQQSAKVGDKYGLYNFALLHLEKGCQNNAIRQYLTLSSNQGFKPAKKLIKKLVSQKCFEPAISKRQAIEKKAFLLLEGELEGYKKKYIKSRL